MSLHSNVTVPLPEKRITYKNGKNGTRYVYYTVRAYRNKAGRATSEEKAIGKLETETGRLIPNQNYFQLFPNSKFEQTSEIPEKERPTEILNLGVTKVLTHLSEEADLLPILKKVFPNKAEKLLTMAMYMLCQGNVMTYLEDWQENQVLPEAGLVRGHHSSHIFSSLGLSDRFSFFENWISRHFSQEYVAYDVSSISTYSKENEWAEWGYNRDKESLPQVNLGLYVGQESKLPAFYNLYSGSISDKSELPFLLAQSKELGLKNVSLVLDRGFLTECNLKLLDELSYPFVIPFMISRKEAKSLLEQYRSEIKSARNYLPSVGMYGIRKEIKLYDLTLYAHLYFNPNKALDTEQYVYDEVERLEEELQQLNRPKRVARRYQNYFEITRKEETQLEFKRDYEKIDERLKDAGFMIYLSSDEQLTPESLMLLYKQRDIIEKNFDNLKNDLDFHRLKTSKRETTEGKVFVAYLALILRSLLSQKLKASGATKSLSIEKALLELSKIRELRYRDLNQVTTLTRKQKEILEAVEVMI
jgi:transposase